MRDRLRRSRLDGARRFARSELGAAMVEFAIVGGLIFAPLVLGILEFGFASWQKNSVASDAREGARYAVVHGSTSGRIATPDSVSNYVKTKTSLDTAGLRIYTVWPTPPIPGGSDPNNDPGADVKVSVAHDVPRRVLFDAANT